MKYGSKAELIEDADHEWNNLWSLIAQIPESALARRRKNQFELDWSVKDVVAHLYEWHRMLLAWHRVGLKGGIPEIPAKGFTWRMNRELNRKIFERHKQVDWKSIRRKVVRSHNQVMKLARTMRERQFMQAGQYSWTGKLSLCSFVSANTASHYRWAQKLIRKLDLTPK